MTDLTLTVETDLETRFSDFIKADERERYEGYVVSAEKLVEFVLYVMYRIDGIW